VVPHPDSDQHQNVITYRGSSVPMPTTFMFSRHP